MPRLTLFKKIMVVTLLLSVLPLLVSSLILLSNLESVNSRLTTEIAGTSDTQASESLQMRAQHVAETIADFLHECEGDLNFLTRTSLDKRALLNFYSTRRSEVWQRRGTSDAPRETREMIPLYRSVAFIDKNGKERVVIRDEDFEPVTETMGRASMLDHTHDASEDESEHGHGSESESSDEGTRNAAAEAALRILDHYGPLMVTESAAPGTSLRRSLRGPAARRGRRLNPNHVETRSFPCAPIAIG